MRSGLRSQDGEKPPAIPITVRQLEAVVRISEALAKMQLLPFATVQHVDEALRLFQVSTLDAAASGSLTGKLNDCGNYLDTVYFVADIYMPPLFRFRRLYHM